MTTYATVEQLAAKWQQPLTDSAAIRAEMDLEEGSALLRRLVPGLDAGLAIGDADVSLPGAVDRILVRKVLIDSILRVMRNPSGATSQTVGPESATFGGLNAKPEVTFTDAELAMVTPGSAGVSVGGFAVGSVRLGRPVWAYECPQVWSRC